MLHSTESVDNDKDMSTIPTSTTSGRMTTLRADAPMFSQQQEEASRQVNIVTPDYNHLRTEKYRSQPLQEVKERDVVPTLASCTWDPADLKYFMESTHDLQAEFRSPGPVGCGSLRSTRSLHSVAESEEGRYPAPLQIPSHSYEPKYYLNSDDPRTSHLSPVPSPRQRQSHPHQQRGVITSPIIGDYRGGSTQLNDVSHTPIRRGTPRETYGVDSGVSGRTSHAHSHTPSDSMSSHGSGSGGVAQPSGDSADGYIYQVHFKRAHRNFLLSHSLSPRSIKAGDFVKVEADRGEDMGVVVSKVPGRDFNEFVPTAGYRGRGFSSGQGEKKFLLRLATPEERAALIEKVRDEEKALEVIREKVMERRLPMTVLDAEYQFDRHKLIFFFEADRRIDFRELVSDLFSLYKTRIWMQQVDTSVLPDHELRTEIARVAGFLPSSYDPRELYNYSDPDVLSNPPPVFPPPLLPGPRGLGSPSSYASPPAMLSPSRLPSGVASSRFGADPHSTPHSQQSLGLDAGYSSLRFGPSQVATSRAVGGPVASSGTMFSFMGEQVAPPSQPPGLASSFTPFPLFSADSYADPFAAVQSAISAQSGATASATGESASRSLYSYFEPSSAQAAVAERADVPLRGSHGEFGVPRQMSVGISRDSSSSAASDEDRGGNGNATVAGTFSLQPDTNLQVDNWTVNHD